jgi:DNA-binding transcriptional MerR regulator
MSTTPLRTISEASESTGLSVDTLRYYEREGLVGPVRRDTSGHRRYAEDDLQWVGIVTCLRDAGLGIADLRRFTELLRSEHEPQERTAFLRRRRDDLQAHIEAMQAAVVVLDEKIAHYSGGPG